MLRKILASTTLFVMTSLAIAPAQASNGKDHAIERAASGDASSLTGSLNVSSNHMMDMMRKMRAMGLAMPALRSDRGRKLFASKGCVVCHSVNGVGGEHAPALDAATMPRPMNPFEFAAKMWRGAEAMIALQRDELGEPIELNGDELADIIAFVHDAKEQQKFSKADIPHRIEALISDAHGEANGHRETDGDHEDR